MKLLYNRKHLHVSVGTALLIGMALGVWIGARIKEAGLFESALVLVSFVAVSHISMAIVDKHYLPRSANFEE